MSKATPRPWVTSQNSIYSSEGNIIAALQHHRNNNDRQWNYEETKTNAELIVRAVNCHEELVKALEFTMIKMPALQIKFGALLRRAKGES